MTAANTSVIVAVAVICLAGCALGELRRRNRWSRQSHLALPTARDCGPSIYLHLYAISKLELQAIFMSGFYLLFAFRAAAGCVLWSCLTD